MNVSLSVSPRSASIVSGSNDQEILGIRIVTSFTIPVSTGRRDSGKRNTRQRIPATIRAARTMRSVTYLFIEKEKGDQWFFPLVFLLHSALWAAALLPVLLSALGEISRQHKK